MNDTGLFTLPSMFGCLVVSSILQLQSAGRNSLVHMSLYCWKYIFSVNIRIGITGSEGGLMCGFARCYQISIHEDCATLHSHQQCTKSHGCFSIALPRECIVNLLNFFQSGGQGNSISVFFLWDKFNIFSAL